MAEMPLMTYAPAVIAALHDATGVWFDEFPLTPDRVLRGLRETVFWSIEMTGESPFTKSTSGFFSCPTNRFANEDIEASSRR